MYKRLGILLLFVIVVTDFAFGDVVLPGVNGKVTVDAIGLRGKPRVTGGQLEDG